VALVRTVQQKERGILAINDRGVSVLEDIFENDIIVDTCQHPPIQFNFR
jgi:hypothetical protein